MEYVNAQNTANRLKVSKTHLINCAHDGSVSPMPIKVPGRNGQWLFSPNAKIVKKTLDKRK